MLIQLIRKYYEVPTSKLLNNKPCDGQVTKIIFVVSNRQYNHGE